MTNTVQATTGKQGTLVAGLAELLTTYPDLPTASWIIDSNGRRLYGHCHDGAFAALNAYATALGGNIRPGDERQDKGRTVRTHWLTTTWRDVPIQVAVVIPVGVVA